MQDNKSASHIILIIISAALCMGFFFLALFGSVDIKQEESTASLAISAYYLLVTLVMLFRFTPGLALMLLPLLMIAVNSFIL